MVGLLQLFVFVCFAYFPVWNFGISWLVYLVWLGGFVRVFVFGCFLFVAWYFIWICILLVCSGIVWFALLVVVGCEVFWVVHCVEFAPSCLLFGCFVWSFVAAVVVCLNLLCSVDLLRLGLFILIWVWLGVVYVFARFRWFWVVVISCCVLFVILVRLFWFTVCCFIVGIVLCFAFWVLVWFATMRVTVCLFVICF